ncbi:MAG TPA: right-handed parallel beta-helix repeat-containing protein [Saprospiraceae bacterium]|nr:right-handed parallel beta-helix repeat-containing protein [Saprospiraceae bacterium]
MKTWTLLFFLWLFAMISVNATTWYVSNSGSDSNNGLSPGMAFLTIQFAENQCGPGDSVLVANGSYAGFYVDVSGTPVAPIVFLANGNAVFVTSPTNTTDGINVEGDEDNGADWIELNGFIVNDMPRNGIRLVYAHNCVVRNCICDSNFERGIFTGFTDDILIEDNVCSNSEDEHGIYVSNSSDRSIIRNNVCHHNNGGGIQINADASQGGDGISSDPEIYGNILYENGVVGGAAINLDGVQGAFIYNNLLYENHATGIALFQQDGAEPAIDATIAYNTIVQASNGRWCLLIVNGATGAQVYNNILINQHPIRGSIALGPDAITGFGSDYNIVVNSMSVEEGDVILTFEEWQDMGYDLNSMLADPIDNIFTDADGGDYHLLMMSQPVDAGNGDFSFGVTTDIEGNTRPTGPEHDIGAYEDQVVLAIEEEEQERAKRKTWWISAEMQSGGIEIHGLHEGDQVLINDMKGRQFQKVMVAENESYTMHTSDWIQGMYVLSVFRNRELLGVKLFRVINE